MSAGGSPRRTTTSLTTNRIASPSTAPCTRLPRTRRLSRRAGRRRLPRSPPTTATHPTRRTRPDATAPTTTPPEWTPPTAAWYQEGAPPTRARPSRPDLVLRFPTPTAPGVGDTLWRGPAGRPLGIIMFPMGRPSPVVGSRTHSGPRLGARMSQCGKDVSMASARPRASRRTSAKPFFTGHYRR